MTITDAGSGLAVSTMALVFGGDGHEGPEPTAAFGVMYSTNAGRNWIDFSTATTMNGGNPLPSAGTINALTMFNGKLYAATAGGYVYSYDGNIWALTNYNLPVGNGGGPAGNLKGLVTFKNRIFAAGASGGLGYVYSSADGYTWMPSSVTAVAFGIRALAAYNGKLFAGDTTNGKVWVSTDGNSWSASQNGLAVGAAATGIQSFGIFNGRLFAGDASGRVWVTVDAATWNYVNGGSVLGAGASITCLTAYNYKFYACDGTANGKVYVSTDNGNSWSAANGGAALGPSPTAITTLVPFDGKLYAGDVSGRVFVSTEGSAWLLTNSGYPVGSNIAALAPFNGRLYAGDGALGDVYQLTPVAAALTGEDGTTSAQTLSATSLNLVSSTNTTLCAGFVPCGATNQVIFTAADRAGNVFRAGPYAIQVDATTSLAISTPSFPANGAYVTMQPNFNWVGPSTVTLGGLPPGSSFYLQVSKNDPGFAVGNTIVNITTPAVVTSTCLPFALGAYLSTYTLTNATTYYWRVQTLNGVFGSVSPWSQTYSFFTDLLSPAAQGLFTVVSSTGGLLGESQINGLALGVTGQVNVLEGLSGLAVSTGALAFAGDGHDNPGATSGFGVMYSTNAGQTWIDASTIASVSNGYPIATGATNLRGFATFGGKLYLADGASGKVYWSPDGNQWTVSNSGNSVGAGGPIRALLVFKGSLYAADAVPGNAGKVYFSADGTNWTTANYGNAISSGGILAMAAFNGRLYASDSAGKVFVSTDGVSFIAIQGGNSVSVASIFSLAVFNGRLYAGDSAGHVFSSVDGSTWSASNMATLTGANTIGSLAAFNNKILAADSVAGKVYASTDGVTWNLGALAAGGAAVQSLAAFNGKLYAGDGVGRVFVSTDGNTWLIPNGGYAIGVSTFYGLAPFNGKLFAADNSGNVYQVTPVSATLGGGDGATTLQAATVYNLNLVNSTNTATCGGVWPCGATNQALFTASSLAGNVGRLGPFAMQVDATTILAVSNLTSPPNGAYVNVQPNFNWSGPSTATLAALPPGTSYFLQVAKNDLNFTAGNIVVSVTTAAWQWPAPQAVSVSTMMPTGFGAYLTTYTLLNNTTYYWRVATINGAVQAIGLWSSSFSFVTDFTPPAAAGIFTTVTSTGGLLAESQNSGLATGVTVQAIVSDAFSGLTVSTAVLTFAGDGHDNPGSTSGFGVIYSSNAGQTWIDFSGAITAMNGGTSVTGGATLRSFAAFNGSLYAADATGRVYSSPDGGSWSASNGGQPVGAGSIRPLIVFNGELYAGDATGKIWNSADGVNWAQTNGGANVSVTGASIQAMTVFNGRLFAGDAASPGRVYVSTTGDSFVMVQAGVTPFAALGGGVQSLGVFNGRLFAGDAGGKLWVSVDGSSLTPVNGGAALPAGYYGVAAANLGSLAAFSNKFFAADAGNGTMFVSTDGTNWTQTNHAVIGSSVQALASFNGKLYAADAVGKVYVSTEGSSWLNLNSSAPFSQGGSSISALAPYNGKLFAGDGVGRVYMIQPVTATLSGLNGGTGPQTLIAFGLNIVNSTNGFVCAGLWPCGATNQVIFTATDRAGLAQRLGPYAVLVDTLTQNSVSVSTLSLPANGAFVNVQPNFNWIGPATSTIAGLPPGSSFYLQVSNNDPTFAPGKIVITISTPAVALSTTMVQTIGAYVSTFTLSNNTTYYWRVSVTNGLFGTPGPASSVFSFVTDLTPPAMSGSFASLGPGQVTLTELQVNNLTAGVTAQISIQDGGSGLAVSTSALAFAGDGHEGPEFTGAYGVLFSTNAGKSWVEFSSPTAVAIGTKLWAITSFNGKLYVADDNGFVWSSPDGNPGNWLQVNSVHTVGYNSPIGSLRTLVTFNNRLFAGDTSGRVFSSADGQSWPQSSATVVSTVFYSSVTAMTAFNSRLYAGDATTGRVYVSTDGNQWTASMYGSTPLQTGGVRSMGVFNGRIFVGDATGKIYMSVDGSSWPFANGGVAPGAAIYSFAAYNNKFFAGDAVGRVFVSTGGDTWYGTNGGAAGLPISSGAALLTMTSFNGKLYAGDAGGRVYVSSEGYVWLVANSSFPVGASISGLAPFNGRLFAVDNIAGNIYQLTPSPALLSGGDGTLLTQTLSATSLNLANSTNSFTCGGFMPCGATNQVVFTAVDRAGNAMRAGPFALEVDATTSLAISTPSFPPNGGYANVQPTFWWIGPSTVTLAGLPPGTSYYLQVSNDPSFGGGNIVVSISTPAVVPSTTLPTGLGAYLSSYTLSGNTTFYWRVATVNGIFKSLSPWSQTYSFVTDFVGPSAAGAFMSVNALAQNVTETQVNGLAQGVVAQMGVQDTVSGLVVATNTLAFAGDGHNNPNVTGGFGVIYSTNAAYTWIDVSTVTTVNNGAVVVTGASQLRGLSVFNGKLYAVDGNNGKIYVTSDGNSWAATNGNSAPGAALRPLLVSANGRIYTADSLGRVFVSATGAAWTPSNAGQPVSAAAVLSLASSYGRVYAGDAAGRVFVSTDGNTFGPTLVGGGPGGNGVIGGPILSLAAYNGRLYAGDNAGRVFVSVDGSSWTASSNGPLVAGSSITALATFNGRLFAADAAKGYVFVSTDGNNWNSGVQITSNAATVGVLALTSFNGKLYASDAGGKVYVSTEGLTWLMTNGGYPVAANALYGLAPFNGRLFAADLLGYMYQLWPVTTTVTGTDGTTGAQTLTASGLNLANSTNTLTCGGVWPCQATDQILFTSVNRAGAVARLGPYAIWVDATTTLAVSTPSFPVGGAYVSTGVTNFNWTGPSTTTIASLPLGTSYYLQVAKNDLNFGPSSIVVSITTPAVQVSTTLPMGFGAYLSTYTLANNATYYWRVATINGADQLQGLWSSTASFVTDLTPPAAAGIFTSVSSTGGALGESQLNFLALGVTAQINVLDAISGLVVSTSVLAFDGDGHDDPGLTGGFGVMYTTNTGQTWIDFSGLTPANGGAPIFAGATQLRGMAVFNGALYAADGANGKIYSSPDGNSWSMVFNSGAAVIRPLVVFNGSLYAGDSAGYVWSSPDGQNWTQSNNAQKLGTNITALGVFNGRLFAGDTLGVGVGRAWVSVDGTNWGSVQGGVVAMQSGGIQSFAAFNGRFYAGDASGKVYVSVDGSTWAAMNSGNPLGGAATNIAGMAEFGNRLYAVDASSRIFFLNQDTCTWNAAYNSAGTQNFGSGLSALAAFNGKLYAADSTYGKIYVSTEGTTWLAINSSFPITTNGAVVTPYPIHSLAPFNGKLYAGDSNGRVYQISPVTATLTGADGATTAQTLTAVALNLVNSTGAAVCGGAWPCFANNQVIFTAFDRGGLPQRFGPYAVLVDTLTAGGVAISTPSLPANGAYVNVQPNFSWMGLSTGPLSGLVAGSSYYLQVANDPAFGAGSIVISISTPAVVVATTVPNAIAGYVSTFTLTNATTYYWRLQTVHGSLGTRGSWSSTSSFVTDFFPPAMSGSFATLNLAGGSVAEYQVNLLVAGVTAQITIQDALSGLAVSTAALTFAGDGHEGPDFTGAFGVMLSTNASKSWIDFTTATTLNNGSPVGAAIYGLTAYNGKLFAADSGGGRVWSSVDGNTWTQPIPPSALAAPTPQLRALVAFNGRLFAADSIGRIFASADGSTNWAQVNGNASVGNSLRSMAVFNGRLYAGDATVPGRVWVSTSGDTWTTASTGTWGIGPVSAQIQALAVFNARLYAGDSTGRISMSVDGSTWSYSGYWSGGTVVGTSVTAFAVFHNRFFASNADGKVYVSTGDTWYPTNAGSALAVPATVVQTLSAFNGKLYAGDASGRVYVSTEGNTWFVTNSSYPVGNSIWNLAPFNGKLFAGDNITGNVYQMVPAAAALSGADGVRTAQTLAATSLNLVNSTLTVTCYGYAPCAATNQVLFTATDRAGNVFRVGPFAILADGTLPTAISTPSYPANGAYVSLQSNLAWTGPSTTTLLGLPSGSSYYLQVSNNDPTFTAGLVVSVSTPAVGTSTTAVVTSTSLPNALGLYVANFMLNNGATYYWRVQLVNGVTGSTGPWSQAYSFVTDFVPPSSVGAFTTLSSTGGLMAETQISNLLTGVVASIGLQDTQSGLAVSTGILAFSGDGHNAPGVTAGLGVIYSTNAGQTWIDASTITALNNGLAVVSTARGMAVFNGRLYLADGGASGKLYSSPDGNVWTVSNGGGGVAAGAVRALAVFNGRLFVADNNAAGKVYASANGNTGWAAVNNNIAVSPTSLPALAPLNGRLYAGDANGRVFVSTDGNSWIAAQNGAPVGAAVQSLAFFNGRYFAGDAAGRVFVSADGSTWTYSNGGLALTGASNIGTMVAFNNKLFAADAGAGKVYVSTDGNTWNAGVAPNGAVQSLAVFNGKLYAGDGAGRLWVSTEASTWLTINGGYVIGVGGFYSLAPFNGRLYAGDAGGNVYQVLPVQASVNDVDGSTALDTLSAIGLIPANSTNTAVCAGAWPCGATNQVLFTPSDLAGNTARVGPYAIQVDATTSQALNYPNFPANGVYVSTQPLNFEWTGPSTTTMAGLPPGTSFYLQVALNDPAFNGVNMMVSIATPAVTVSTTLSSSFGSYVSTYTLANNATYYWRVVTINGASQAMGLWSAVYSFVTDLTPPAQSGIFTSLSATGTIAEGQINGLATGVTAQVGVQDVISGLVVSTNVLAFAGDGHDNPGFTGGFGVMYSTNAGQTWIDLSTVTRMNSGNPVTAGAVRGLAVSNGRLYAADGLSGKIYSSPDGYNWAAVNGGLAISGQPIRAMLVGPDGRFYVGDTSGRIYTSNNGGANWVQANSNLAVGSNIAALAAFNGRLYAGDAATNRVYVSTSGDSWNMAQGGVVAFAAQGGVQSLAAFNGRLYAGDSAGKVYASVDGSSWAATNNSNAVGTYIVALTPFNNRLYAVDASSRVFFMNPDGITWTQSWNIVVGAGGSPTPALNFGSSLSALASLNGKLYAADATYGKIYVSTEGSTWMAINSSYPIVNTANTGIYSLAPFNGQLYAGDQNGRVYQVTPVTATLTGADGATTAQTLVATGLRLVVSTNATVCGGTWPCGATNQVLFAAIARNGAVGRFGPYAVLVDSMTPGPIAVSTPSLPANGAFTNVQPNFSWVGMSTPTLAGLPSGSSYYLQVSNNDPAFAPGSIVIAISTPATVTQPMNSVPAPFGAYLSTYTLLNGATYYWRVAAVQGVLGTLGPWSSTSSFVTDFIMPFQASTFVSFSSIAVLGETQANSLLSGVTAQVGVQDAGSGLAVSTSVLTFAGDGHEGPDLAGGYGVLYSTNAAKSWIEFSTVTTRSLGAPLLSLTAYNGRLYAADITGYVWSSPDGLTWAQTNSGWWVGNPTTAGSLRGTAAFNG
ncbi:MAG: hypothetical protein NTX64_01740, partial [Elusimicrobia bacterium]|nr:hypothetical protein [Elusimicrobiota bacterium]